MLLDNLFAFKNAGGTKDDQNLFNKERLALNLKRLDILVVVSAVFFFILLLIDIFVLLPRYNDSRGYTNLFWGHVLMLTFIGIYPILRMTSKNLFKNERWSRFIDLTYYYFGLMWCTFSAINSQLTHKKISVYLVAVFIISSYAVLSPLESGLMIFSSYILLLASIIIMDKDLQILIANIINSTMMVFLAYIFSIVNYKAHFYNVISSEMIRKKSEALQQANYELSKEIETVNELYEEKDILLNKALEYESLRTNFFSNISHELRTPINVILCAQQMLGLNTSGNSKQNVKYVNMIRQNCYRLLKLTNNIIDINKIDAGRLELNFGNYDIIKITEDICMSVSDYIKSKDISFVFDTDIEEKIITCDPEKIERILLNLLSNAIKFTKPGGNISVNICSINNTVEISVQDTGIGIPKDKQFMVFERFVQLDNSLSRNYEGSGIGLALVSNLVEMHDGSIRLESEEGSGSKFIVSLPDKKGDTPGDHIDEAAISMSGTDKVQKINVELSDIYYDWN